MEKEVLDIDTAIKHLSSEINIQIQKMRMIDAIPEMISMDENIYENLSKDDAEKILHQIKIALITVSAIKAMGLNKNVLIIYLSMYLSRIAKHCKYHHAFASVRKYCLIHLYLKEH